MHQVDIKTQETSPATVRLHEARRLLTISWQLSDMLEDMLEEHRGYTREFLYGLKKSLKDARARKTVQIHSLGELA